MTHFIALDLDDLSADAGNRYVDFGIWELEQYLAKYAAFQLAHGA